MAKKPKLIAGALAAVPDGRFKRFGFGTSPVPRDEWDERITSAERVLSMIEGHVRPDASEAVLDAISVTKGMFSRIALCDRYDWFSVARMMGYPSSEFSRQVSNSLAHLRFFLVQGDTDGAERELRRLQDVPASDCLQEFLAIARDGQHPENEEGWAYILWSSSERDLLHIGAAGGTVDDVLARLRRDYPGHDPFGVMAAWLVHDPLEAYGLVRETFDSEMVGDGFYRIGLREARKRLGSELVARDLLALSPWHEGPVPEVSIVSAR